MFLNTLTNIICYFREREEARLRRLYDESKLKKVMTFEEFKETYTKHK